MASKERSPASLHLAALRKEAGLSVRAMARKLGLPRSTYGRYETDYQHERLPANLVTKVAEVLQLHGRERDRLMALSDDNYSTLASSDADWLTRPALFEKPVKRRNIRSSSDPGPGDPYVFAYRWPAPFAEEIGLQAAEFAGVAWTDELELQAKVALLESSSNYEVDGVFSYEATARRGIFGGLLFFILAKNGIEDLSDAPDAIDVLLPDRFCGDGSFDLDFDVAIRRCPRPRQLQQCPKAYALYVLDALMSPRCDRGDLIYVDPDASPVPGDDVIVVLDNPVRADGKGAFFGRLLSYSAKTVDIAFLNPAKTINIAREAISGVHYVVPIERSANDHGIGQQP